MKKQLLIISCALLAACADKQDMEWVCTSQEREKVAEFVSTNTKAANNMSDEEMEDVIKQLTSTGVHTFCHQELLWQSNEGVIRWERNKLDSGETYHSQWSY